MNLENFELIYKDNRCKIEDKQKIISKLIEILGKDNVSDEEIDILAYTKDMTLISLNWVIQGQIAGLPDIITFPETIDQISKILKLANEEKIPVIPYAEGSGVVGGAIAVFGGIIIDLKKFNKILSINDKDLTVMCEAGVNGMNLERYLNAKGYTTGHIPQSLYTSSVGGWIAHRAAGQFSTKYGKIEDIVLGMDVMLPQGDIINFKPIARASTGPQLDKFFIGNEGTLGVVTKATLKIWPFPEKRAMLSYAFPTIEDSLEATRLILRKQIYPAVVRIYDASETNRHFSEVEKAANKVMVVFVCEGIERLVDLEEIITREVCEKNSGVDCGKGPVEHWFETRFKVAESSMFPPNKIVADTLEVAIMWDNAAKLYHKVIEEAEKVKGLLLVTAHISHFYSNGVGYYFTFGAVPPKGKTDFELYQEIWNTIVKTVEDCGGSFGHHHGVGISRSHWMEREWGKVGMDTLKMIKNGIDPNNIFNPGKVFVNVWKEKKEERGDNYMGEEGGFFDTLKKYKWILPVIEKADRDIKRIAMKNFRLKKKNFYPEGEYKADVKNLINCMLCPNMCRFDCGTLQATNTEAMSPTYKARIGYYLSIGKIDPTKEENKPFIDLIYKCTNEENCKVWCPFDFSVVSLLETVREDLNDKGMMPDYCKKQIEKLKRTNTIEDHNIYETYKDKGIENIETDGSDDVFYYIGCESMKFPEVVKANIQILKKAGVKFSTNLDKKMCCGGPAFNIRDLKTAKEFANRNKELIKSTGAKIVVSDCPGCIVTLTSRYQKEGIEIETKAMHIVEYIKDLLNEGKIKLEKQIPEEFSKITIHDPCLLARNLKDTTSIREILDNISGLEVTEPLYSKENAHCCGWSGTLHWADKETAIKEAKNRINELKETSYTTFVSACALCELGLAYGLEETEKDKFKILDISELLAKLL